MNSKIESLLNLRQHIDRIATVRFGFRTYLLENKVHGEVKGPLKHDDSLGEYYIEGISYITFSTFTDAWLNDNGELTIILEG